ncbi:hypothetical protein ACFV27_30795 [Streptomyces antimycoticus]|uniref:SLAC1 family transporter n=1 Tax=Streptomyces antimycoticus TaxID=68175 RepID=UPI00369A97D3
MGTPCWGSAAGYDRLRMHGAPLVRRSRRTVPPMAEAHPRRRPGGPRRASGHPPPVTRPGVSFRAGSSSGRGTRPRCSCCHRPSARLITGHFSRFGEEGARWAYAVFVVAAALVAARLLAHWFTGALSETTLHPGYLLPVSSAPFIASITASTLHLPEIAAAAFAVGVLYWLAFGTVILGGLVAGGPLPPPARPTLTVLVIPPAVGSNAWLAAHGGRLDGVGYGFSGILFFTLVLVAFMLPTIRERSFHTGLWIYSFPVAATTNFLVRWTYAADVPGREIIVWALLAVASGGFLLLGVATLVHGGRHWRLRSGSPDLG